MIEYIIGGTIFAVVWVLTLISHESGHWLVMRLYGFREIKFRLGIAGDIEIGNNLHKEITLRQTFWSTLAGPVTGLIPIFILNNFMDSLLSSWFVFLYIYVCSGDIRTLMLIHETKLDKEKTLYDLNRFIWEGYQQEVDSYGG